MTNNAGVAFDEVELLLVDVGGSRPPAGVLSLGALWVLVSRALRWEFEADAPYQPEAGLAPVIAGSVAGDAGERRALWVDTDVEVTQ